MHTQKHKHAASHTQTDAQTRRHPRAPLQVGRQHLGVDSPERHLVFGLHACEKQTQHVVVATGRPAIGHRGR